MPVAMRGKNDVFRIGQQQIVPARNLKRTFCEKLHPIIAIRRLLNASPYCGYG